MKYIDHTVDLSFDRWHEIWSDIVLNDDNHITSMEKIVNWRKEHGITQYHRVENSTHVFVRFYFKSEKRIVEFKLRYG